ncbi:MAG: TA system VapC family ribonuclease toxin [Acidobacteriaceae bacterium]|jgi:toxin-antitoxin system PIN domain toxin
MAVCLLDVNVLVALFTADHSSHSAARVWFAENAKRGWATCPVTQAGFVRIASNPSARKHAVPPGEAVELLRANLMHPAHEFWRDDMNYVEAAEPFLPHLYGHQQVTDVYLLGLALRHKGRLVTFDQGPPALAAAAGYRELAIRLRA